MSEEQMLKEIIEKAEKNGWKHDFGNEEWIFTQDATTYDYEKLRVDGVTEHIIFDHSFLKAFFGEMSSGWSGNLDEKEWQYQAEKLVLSEDRIKYLHRFI